VGAVDLSKHFLIVKLKNVSVLSAVFAGSLVLLPSVIIISFFLPDAAPTDYPHRLAGQQLALYGSNEVPACATCHGPEGEGDFRLGIPRLAGLHPEYIKKQLEDFSRNPLKTRVVLEPIARDYVKTPRTYGDLTVFTPGTRNDLDMNDVARRLSEADRHNLAIYFSKLSFMATPTAYDFETLERGEDLALRGKPEYGLPACVSCHGPKGEGFGAVFPPLAGQPLAYLVKQIDQWQTGKRDNDHLSLMKNIAIQLTDGDKINVAAYFSNQSYSVNLEKR